VSCAGAFHLSTMSLGAALDDTEKLALFDRSSTAPGVSPHSGAAPIPGRERPLPTIIIGLIPEGLRPARRQTAARSRGIESIVLFSRLASACSFRSRPTVMVDVDEFVHMSFEPERPPDRRTNSGDLWASASVQSTGSSAAA